MNLKKLFKDNQIIVIIGIIVLLALLVDGGILSRGYASRYDAGSWQTSQMLQCINQQLVLFQNEYDYDISRIGQLTGEIVTDYDGPGQTSYALYFGTTDWYKPIVGVNLVNYTCEYRGTIQGLNNWFIIKENNKDYYVLEAQIDRVINPWVINGITTLSVGNGADCKSQCQTTSSSKNFFADYWILIVIGGIILMLLVIFKRRGDD